MRHWIKQRMKLTSIALIGYLGLYLLGCQQTQIDFTDSATATLPQFDKIQAAPVVNAMHFELKHSVEQQNYVDGSKLFIFSDPQSGLDKLTLVAYSKLPFANVDVLLAAFEQKRRRLSAKQSLSCADSIRFRPSLHSIAISISCYQLPTEAATLLSDFWQADSFTEIDIGNVKRQLKLAKHINAFSGAEIDTVWAKTILGEAHIYNQALNDSELADNLTLAKLNAVRNTILSQSSWAVLSNQALLSGETGEKSLPNILLSDAAALSIAVKAATDYSDTPQKKQPDIALGNEPKNLYVIDAPDSVQTQIRVGYPLARKSSTSATNQAQVILENSAGAQDCQLLASWLGRSFSGRLYYDLREVRGLTYGIYGRCYDNPLSRTIKFYGSTQLQHTGAFIDGVLKHLTLAADSPVSQAELKAIKTYNSSKLLLRQDNPMALEADTIRQLTSGYSPAYPQMFADKIAQLNADELQAIASHVFSRTPYIVIRGDLDKIRQDLQQKLPNWQIIEVSAND